MCLVGRQLPRSRSDVCCVVHAQRRPPNLHGEAAVITIDIMKQKTKPSNGPSRVDDKTLPSPLGRGLGGGADVSHTNRLRLEALHRYSPCARSSSGPRHRPAGVRWAAEPLSSRTRRRAHRIHIDDSLLNGNRRGYRAGGGHRRYQDAKPASRAWLEQVSQRCTFVQQLFRKCIYGCALTSGFVGHSRTLY